MHVKRTVASMLAVVGITMLWTATPAAAAGHQLISGSGSSWAANAVTQWIADVHSRGLQVVFSSTGSAQGRQDYANNIDDFAVSDIGYQGNDATGNTSDKSNRPYAYLPIVAGGTALPYQIRKNGQLVRNLRLSGPTLAKIFSQKITNWDDPAITTDNHGNKMPNLKIIPVVHSEGSGSTYQFTRYLAKDFGSIWNSFSKAGATEYFPQNGTAVRQNGSDGMMNFITSGAANGAIGYDEYSYALGKNYPVAKVLNAGGYYTLPNQYNVAVALTKAKIDRTTLLQTLDNVYTDRDRRTYPISSYSYAIIPTSKTDSKMNTAKRQTLADYLDYSVCQGQAEMGKVGYSPLPINLVESSFAQVKRLHSADSGVNVSQATPSACHNPTFIAGNPRANYLAKVAPQPESCDKQGAGPCTDNGNTGQLNPNQGGAKTSKGSSGNSAGSNSSGGSGGSSSTNAAGGSSSGANTGASTGTAATGAAAGTGATATKIDPATGQLVAVGNTSNGQLAQGESTALKSSQSKSTDILLSVLAGLLLLVALIVPPLASSALSRRKAGK